MILFVFMLLPTTSNWTDIKCWLFEVTSEKRKSGIPDFLFFNFQKRGFALKISVPCTCCGIFLWIQWENICVVNLGFYAELGWQWKHFNWIGSLICLTVSSSLSSSFKRELSLELVCSRLRPISLCNDENWLEWRKPGIVIISIY